MTDYDVGYRKPPKQSQFKKGETGNPRGRPKRPTHAVPEMSRGGDEGDHSLQEAYRLVDINEDGKKTRLPLIQAIIRRLGCVRRAGTLTCDALLYGDAASARSKKQRLRVLGLCQGVDRLTKKRSEESSSAERS